MPTKRILDLVIITSLLLHPAVGLLKMSARRQAREGQGTMAMVGEALVVAL